MEIACAFGLNLLYTGAMHRLREWLRNWLGIEASVKLLVGEIREGGQRTHENAMSVREMGLALSQSRKQIEVLTVSIASHKQQLESIRLILATWRPVDQKLPVQLKSWRDTLAFIGDPNDVGDNASG